MAGNFLGNCLCNLFTTSVFITGCATLLVTAFPIAQITIGAVYIYECPAAPAIPVYVMVCGIMALLLMSVFTLPTRLCPAAPGNKIWTLWILTLVLFVIVWFLFGSYQIYSVYPPNYTKITTDPNNHNNSMYSPTAADTNQTMRNISSETNRLHSTPAAHHVMAVAAYCDRTVYLFAFWTTTLVYVFAGHALVISLCIYGCMKTADILTHYFAT